ncbi:hypothetical protein [Novosphingobium sp. NDB2Meth1]|uniref:hypothetical protein n=1 Tax=Novosphingobium sp. NDB2Meth1 TaxID=1892847 RepID=UPI0009300E91|nr:hypothetical protein [Novosphingobium sp. NDB2Meth1]
MHIIISVAALDAVTDDALRPMLAPYRETMDLAVIFIVQPGDTLDTLHQARGWPFEHWEFILHHTTGWFECVFVLSQDGAGHAVLIPNEPTTDTDLLHLCYAHAVPAVAVDAESG